MHIDQITINGFKAFADKETILFNRGICALVGPNGSGKSNVIDAIKWVIGEQKISELRGERFEDLIFNGSQKFKAQNFAEVELKFDNSEKKFPINYEQLSVMRRIYRSGESEFFINRQNCRLKDIQDIFLNSGLGKSSYAIIPQGKVDQILSDKVEEKRKLFEEAAAIAKFRERRREYEGKIAKAQENLVRVNDLLKQSYRRRNQLSRQSGDTAKFFELNDQIKEIQINLLLHELFINQEATKSFEKSIKLNNEKIHNLQIKLEILKKDIQALNSSLNSDRLNLNEMEKERIKNEQKKSSLEQEKVWLEEGVKDTKRILKNLDENLQKVQNEIIQNQKRIEQSKAKMEISKGEVAKSDESIALWQEELLELDGQIKTLEKERDILNDILNKKEVARAKINEEEQKILLQLIKEIDTLKKDLEKKNIIASRDTFNKKLDGLIETIIAIDTDRLSEPGMIARVLEVKNSIMGNRIFFKNFFEEEKRFYHFFFSAEGTYSLKERLVKELESILEEIATTRNHLATNQFSFNEKISRKETLMKKVEQEKFNLSGYEQNIITLNRDIDEKKTTIQSVKEMEKKMLVDKEFSLKKREEFEGKISENTKHLDRIIQSNQAILKKIDGFFKQQKDKKEKFELSIKQKTEIQNEIEITQKENYEHSAQVQVSEGERKSIYEKGSYQCSVDLRQCSPARVERIEEVRRELSQLERELQSLGTVNPLAKEEFDEVSKRIEEVETQKEDIIESIADLKRVTEETVEEGKKIFLSTFNEVNKNFSVLIQELFPGGKGAICLSDQKDPLEADISIIVQPQGKKFQKLNLFSGGERSLIVLAFIFSFFLRKPSPFCLLDEVDAALDSNNIERFMRILKKIEKHTQVILISHNQKTMQIVDYIYGFSMKDGITKILSLKV